MRVLHGKDVRQLEDFDQNWAKRDFVQDVLDYINSKLNKVMIISGLRGTGKTVGMYQATLQTNALYLCCEYGENNSAADYIRTIEEAGASTIIIDEHTWIKGRDTAKFERHLDSFVSKGKRIILTGTESASLEALSRKDLIHRTVRRHVTHFSFEEYKRLYSETKSMRPQDVYDSYLKTGGVFQNYISNTAHGLDDYIQNSIVDNLYSYIGSKALPREKVAAAVYTVLFEAIHDTLNVKPPHEVFTAKSLEKLSNMGIIDINDPLDPSVVQETGKILEEIGVIIKVPNIIPREQNKYFERGVSDDNRLYIVNQSMSWQFINSIFGNVKDEKRILGRLFECATMCELYYHKHPEDDLYFYEGMNGEIDAVIAPHTGDSPIYFFEAKHRFEISDSNIQKGTWTILTEKADKEIATRFPNNDICRYFVYTGSQQHKKKDDKEFLLVGLDDKLYEYWNYEENKRDITEKEFVPQI